MPADASGPPGRSTFSLRPRRETMNARTLLGAAMTRPVLSTAALAASMTPAQQCTALEKQFDQEIVKHARPPRPAQAKTLRTEGGKLCLSGKNDDGVKKLEAGAQRHRREAGVVIGLQGGECRSPMRHSTRAPRAASIARLTARHQHAHIPSFNHALDGDHHARDSRNAGGARNRRNCRLGRPAAKSGPCFSPAAVTAVVPDFCFSAFVGPTPTRRARWRPAPSASPISPPR